VDVDVFLTLAEHLTGTPVKEVTESDRQCLRGILADETRQIHCSQFNELLLLVNKDRVTECFFKHFFGNSCTVGDLKAGVEKFQKTGMLCFGNFIYAFRTLSCAKNDDELRAETADFCRTSAEHSQRFANRVEKLLDVELIPKADTPFVGYLAPGEVLAEFERAKFLKQLLPKPAQLAKLDWPAFIALVAGATGAAERPALESVVARYRLRYPAHGLTEFAAHLDKVVAQLAERDARIKEVRAIATRNQDIYLTWDHMDVYFATSMRKQWEFEDLFDFVEGVMSNKELTALQIRYFNPTQAFTLNRVNKGLVESLMLKRARCNVYSVQDTDTLGKDSELAATLAQGKTVIAYVPKIDVNERTNVLAQEDPSTIQDRLRFVVYADQRFASSLNPDDLAFVRDFRELEAFETRQVWRSIPDAEVVAELRAAHGPSIERLCRIIAASEARIYESRAKTLRESHPLAIQVNLATGVANGVLVVRSIEDCSRLLCAVLLNSMEFDLIEHAEHRMWYLNERISGCPFRVVSKDRKLTNCFWNFYRNPAN
jgi:hypothetical protein